MQQQPLNTARILAVVIFALTCFGLLLYLWDSFGGPVPLKARPYRVVVALPEADLLANEADVRISGVTIGHVVSTSRTASRTEPNRKDAVLEIDHQYAPLHRDVRAIIRRKSLAGEMYLELTPGGPHTPAIPDGGRLASANVAPSVEIDEVLRTFDAPTRRAFDQWIQGQGGAVEGRGQALNDALGNLPAFEDGLTRVMTVLAHQQGAVRAAVSNTGAVFDAIGRRRSDLHGLIVNANRTFSAFAAQSRAFADTWRALPAFESNSRALLDRAESFRRNAAPVISELHPAAVGFSRALTVVPPTARELDALVRDVRPVTDAGERGLPAARRFLDRLRPFIGEFVPFLAQFEPVLAYIEPQADAIPMMFGNVSAATEPVTPSDGADPTPIHYVRTAAVLGPSQLAFYPHRLPGDRSNPYELSKRDWVGGKVSEVFDDANCGPAVFPRIADADGTNPIVTQTMVDRLRHFALNDGQAVAPPCLQQRSGTTRFPQVEALTQTPRGAP